MIGRLIWASVAFIAALATFGFAISAVTLALVEAFGVVTAVASVAALLLTLTVLSVAFVLYAPWKDDEETDEIMAVRLARDVIRKQPLSAVALMGAVGFAAAKKPKEAADIGRGITRLLLN